MIACAFASCSKDDVIDPDDGGNGGNSSGKTMLQVISYGLTFCGGAVFGIAILCLLQAGKGYPKKEE